MESSADIQFHGLSCPCLQGFCHSFLYGCIFAGNDYLPVAVVVGRNHGTGHGLAYLLNRLLAQTYDCRHRARNRFAAALHSLRSLRDQSHTVLEVHRPGADESGEFAQRMACDHIRGSISRVAERLADGVQEDCRLGDLGCLELLVRAVEHYFCQFKSQYFISFVHHFSSLMVALIQFLAHSAELRALSWKNISFNHNFFVYLRCICALSLMDKI